MTKPQQPSNSHRSSIVSLQSSAPLATRPSSARFNRVSGFTLIELMIALALGLLVVAAAIAIFISSQRSLSLQAGMGEVQENANFGLAQIAHDLRHANLNTASNQYIDAHSNGSGIIFTAENLPATITAWKTDYVSAQDKDNDNTENKSDRLTIQYVPVTDEVITCTGETLGSATNKVLIQRYYLKKSPKQVTGEPTAYSLMCDAGWYPTGGGAITGLNVDGGEQLMQRVDAFKVQVSVKLPSGNRRYVGLNEYLTKQNEIKAACTAAAITCEYWQILAVEIGILARSTGAIGSNAALNTQTEYTLAGTKVTLDGSAGKDALNKKYLRQAVNQVIAFRNTLGAE